MNVSSYFQKHIGVFSISYIQLYLLNSIFVVCGTTEDLQEYFLFSKQGDLSSLINENFVLLHFQNELLKHAITLMNLKNMLSGKNETKESIYFINPFIQSSKTNKIVLW